MENLHINYIKEGLKSKSADSRFYHSLLSILKSIEFDNTISGIWHPLGFIIVTIQDWHLGERLRIHIWPKSIRKFNQDRNWIHNHEYNINSLVLVGSIINKKYGIKKRDKGLPIYNVLHKGNNSDLQITDEFCDISFLSCEKINKGEIYTIKKSEFHLSETKTEKITSTIVLNTKKHKKSPTIIGIPEKNDALFKYERSGCDKLFLNSLVSELISEINKKIENTANHD